MSPPLPFLYLAALRRSGSKVMARALTAWPSRYVFLEPGLAMPTMRAKPEPTELLAELGMDLPALTAAIHRLPPEDRPAAAVRTVFAPLRERVPLVGVKEIRHAHADLVLDAMGPETRIVVLVRDPRGILDSLRRKEAWRENPIEFDGGLSPAALADHLREQLDAQRRMLETRTALAVRYEDLCTDPSVLDSVRAFCGIRGDRTDDLWRLDGHEHGAHGDRVGNVDLDRWRHDEPHADEAAEIHQRLADECAYWGYPASGDRTPRPPGPPPRTLPSTVMDIDRSDQASA